MQEIHSVINIICFGKTDMGVLVHSASTMTSLIDLPTYYLYLQYRQVQRNSEVT